MKPFPVLAACLLPTCAAFGATFHVNPSAAPGGDGSEPSPFSTLETARDAIRANPGGGHEVVLHPGVYARTEPLIFQKEDGGAKGRPVVWRAFQRGSVLFEGGVSVPPERWEQPSLEETQRLDPTARGNVRCLDLSAIGVKNAKAYPGKFQGRGGLLELHSGEERQPLSRWPDGFPEKSALMGDVLERGSIEKGVQKPGRFRAQEDRCLRWKVDRGLWLEGYWRAPWEPVFLKVAAMEAKSRTITFGEALPNGIGSKYAKPPALGNRDEPWWAVNLPEEITVPGEWAVDFPSQRLFWWPPSEGALADAKLSDMEGPMLRFNGVSHVRWEGIHVVRGLGNGLELKECRHVELAGLEVRQCGGSGVVVNGGSQNIVRSCDLHDLGESGIQLTGGERKTLTPSGHLAENNHIWRVGALRKTYAPGILIASEWGGGGGDGSAVGCIVRHNLVHDTPHAGILYGGNNHVIELNELARTVLTSSDMGAIYTQGDWASQGNLVRHNFIHDNPRAIGVYLDDGDSGDTVEGNLFVRNINGPSVCGGHHNVVRENVVFDCNRFGIYMDARGVARGYDLASRHYRKLRALPFQQSPWSERYPALVHLIEKDTRLPHDNLITRNVTARCPKPEHRNGRPDEFKHSVLEGNADFGAADPGFVDAARGDFRLRPDSAIFKNLPGFKAPPFKEMGLIRDAYRSAPVNAEGVAR
jgi:hypothetical protein